MGTGRARWRQLALAEDHRAEAPESDGRVRCERESVQGISPTVQECRAQSGESPMYWWFWIPPEQGKKS